MEQVNALKLRNNLGEILDRLAKKGEPILISKGKKLCAVLVTLEQFEKRFLDVKANEKKERFINNLKSMKKPRVGTLNSLDMLRNLRGYET